MVKEKNVRKHKEYWERKEKAYKNQRFLKSHYANTFGKKI